MIKKVIVVLGIITMFSLEALAATIEFDAAADTMLWKDQSATNYVSNWANGAGFINPENYGAGAPRHAVIQFDVSIIPHLSTINSATIKLWVSSVSLYNGAASFPLEVHGVTTPWIDTEATWNSSQNAISWNSEGGDYGPVIDTQNIIPVDKGEDGYYIEFDITSLVADWVEDPAANFGAIFLAQEQPQYVGQPLADQPVGVVQLGSHTAGIPSWHPLLTVEYSATTVPEPASILLLMAGMIGLIKRFFHK